MSSIQRWLELRASSLESSDECAKQQSRKRHKGWCIGKGFRAGNEAAEMSDQRTEETCDKVRRSRYAEGAWPMRCKGAA